MHSQKRSRTFLKADPDGVARFFVNKRYLEACQHGPRQHSIAIAARRDRRRVDAIVRLFGELSYFVGLSDHYDGSGFLQHARLRRASR